MWLATVRCLNDEKCLRKKGGRGLTGEHKLLYWIALPGKWLHFRING